jgi:hypothetical protein
MPRIRPVFNMTFRVQRSAVDDAVVLVLSGDIAGDHTADLETIVRADGNSPVILDLKDVSVVDRAGVLLLARSEGRGATLSTRPAAYLDPMIKDTAFGLHSSVGRLIERAPHLAVGVR